MTIRTQLWYSIRSISDRFQDRLSAKVSLFCSRPTSPNTFGIMTREVYDLIAGMDDVRMITTPNPPHLPIAMFEFEYAGYKCEVRLQSLNGFKGADPGDHYDTSVSVIVALTRWLVPDATNEEMNALNAKCLNCRAVKVGDFVEIAMVSDWISLRGHEQSTIKDMILSLASNTKVFVQDLVSSR
nr:hypothetical protein [Sphingomonas melonis]